MQILLTIFILALIFSLLFFSYKEREQKYAILTIHTGNKDRNISLKEYINTLDEYLKALRYKKETNHNIHKYIAPTLLSHKGKCIEVKIDSLSIDIRGAYHSLEIIKGILESSGSSFSLEPDQTE